jgi:hypothetical protein
MMRLTRFPRHRSLVVATVLIGTSVAALWAKWSYLAFSSSGWPQDPARAMAGLFATGVVLAFGAVALSHLRWRWIVQIIAVLCFVTLLVLPIDVDRWLPPPTIKYRHDEQLITVRARPLIEHKANFDILVLATPELSETPIRLYVGRELGSKLREDHVIEFTVWRTRDVLLPGWRVEGYVPPLDDKLETVRDGVETLYDARICPIHHVTMQRLELPVHHGLPYYDDAWSEFAGGPGFVQGGCVGTPQQTTMGYRCPVCAARYEKWVAELTARDRRRETGDSRRGDGRAH